MITHSIIFLYIMSKSVKYAYMHLEILQYSDEYMNSIKV
jgi:hypothetical protein